MGGQRGVPPGRGFEGAGAPRQPQCITLGRLAPRHYAVRRRPRCPRLARPSGAPHESGAVEGPAVSETEIGAGGVPGCSGMPGAWKSQPARQSSRIPGAGHGRTPWRLRCRHGAYRPMRAGRPGLQRPRNDRRFPPPGVKDVASYGWPPYKGGVAHPGGARF